MKSSSSLSRRSFLTTATVAGITAPNLLTAKKAQSKQLVIGEGEHRFEVHHGWAQLPDKYSWQTTHNVAVDKAGNLYVIHEGRANQKNHPSIFVFDPDGKFIRAFGNQFPARSTSFRSQVNNPICTFNHVKIMLYHH